MKHIKRWCLMRCNTEENLTEHSYQSAVIAHALALIKNKLFDGNVNAENVAAVALFHDSSEVITGDMPTPVKYSNPKLKEAYKEMEKEADNRLLEMLPDFLKEEYGALLNIDENSEVFKIVKAADKISAYIKCVEETSSGNVEFSVAEKKTKAAIDSLDMPEVKYFMEHCIEGFFMPLDVL